MDDLVFFGKLIILVSFILLYGQTTLSIISMIKNKYNDTIATYLIILSILIFGIILLMVGKYSGYIL